jgi:uncharacterized repeat protein (TIGR03803 family)
MSIARRLAIATFIAGATTAPLAANAGTFTTLYTFTGGTDGEYPRGQLVYQNGSLYGVTQGGLKNDENGNVFAIDMKTATLTEIYEFTGGANGSDPNDLIYHNGMFYGTTLQGGSGCNGGCGTVFALNAKTGKLTVLYSFPDPGNGNQPFPGGLIYESGVLYGVTTSSGNNNNGMIFAINLGTGVETTVFDFDVADGLAPNPSLVFNSGLLYGTTGSGGPNSCKVYNTHAGCGVVFGVDPTTGAENTIYAFTDGADGFWPTNNLIYYKGLLYGGTRYGGDMSCGRMGCGTFFSIDPSTGAENVLNANTDLAQAIAGLADHGASIYETLAGTYRGHHVKLGALVKFDLRSGHETVLHTFTGGADGSHPESPLTYSSGVYYGTTSEDGDNSGCGNTGCGTVFQYVP